MKKLLYLCVAVLLLQPFVASGGPSANKTDVASLALLPPVVKHEGETQDFVGNSQSKFNPTDAYNRAVSRLEKEVKIKKWALEIVPPETVQPAFLSIVGPGHAQGEEVKFNQLKEIADKLNVRYLGRVTINELTSYRKTNTLTPMNSGRAGIELFVYDRDTNEFVWQMEYTASSARGGLFGAGSLSERQDQALLNSLLKTLEPFANGGPSRQQCEAETGRAAFHLGTALSLDSSLSVDTDLGFRYAAPRAGL